MNYHNITKDDMNNGDGLRVVLWVSGCSHRCDGCQNPQTWNPESGIKFDESAMNEILRELDHDYISGLTLSGGDPLYQRNLETISKIIDTVREKFPEKTIWLYTGYTREEIQTDSVRWNIVQKVDVVVEGEFEKDKADANYHWAGSTNQRVIEIKKGAIK